MYSVWAGLRLGYLGRSIRSGMGLFKVLLLIVDNSFYGFRGIGNGLFKLYSLSRERDSSDINTS